MHGVREIGGVPRQSPDSFRSTVPRPLIFMAALAQPMTRERAGVVFYVAVNGLRIVSVPSMIWSVCRSSEYNVVHSASSAAATTSAS